MCFIEKCTFTHLAGTERHQQNLQSPYQQNASHNIPKSFSHNNYDQRFIQPPNVQYSAYSNYLQQNNPKKHRGEFLYQQNDFPPLNSSNDAKMTEISLSIKQLQKNMEFLMHSVQFKDATAPPRLQPNFQQVSHQPMPSQFSYNSGEAKNP